MKENSPRSLFIVCLLLLTLALAGCEGSAEFRQGQKRESEKNLDEAVIAYQKALEKDPRNPEYRLNYERTRSKASFQHQEKAEKLEKDGKYELALTEYDLANKIDPSNVMAQTEYDRLKKFIENPTPGAPPTEILQRMRQNETDPNRVIPLSPVATTPLTLKITDTAKRDYETIAKLAGVNVVFDPDFDRSGGLERMSLELNNVSLVDALEIMAIRSRTFWKPLNSNTILVVPDNQSKRRDYEDQIVKTIYLSNSLAPTDLTETVNAVRQLLTLKAIVQSNALNAIIIRDTPDKVAIAEKIIQSIDKAKPEVIIDVAVLEVDSNLLRDFGITPVSPGGAGLSTTGTFNNMLSGGAQTTAPTGGTGTTGGTTTGGTTTNLTPGTVPINRLGHITGGSFSVVIPSVQAQALESSTRAKLLQNPQLRASDGKLAKIRIGQKVPISTGSFTPFSGGGAVAGNIFSQFQYQDVGVNMDITPKVHLDRQISLTVKVEISSVAGNQNFAGLLEPIFNTRSVEHDITLKEGEANILAGIISDQDTKTISGIPGLSRVPFFGSLFTAQHTDRQQQEFIIVLTPHIVRLPKFEEANLQGLYVGTDSFIEYKGALPRLGQEPAPAAATPASAQGAIQTAPPMTPSVSPATPQPTPPAAAPPVGTPFRLTPSTGVFPPDKPFTMTINVEDIHDLFSASLALAWDPKVIRLKDVTEGGFLGRDEQPIALVQRPDNDAGTVIITLTRPPETSAMSGSGNLVTLSFEPVAPGQTSVVVSQLFARNPVGERIPAAPSASQIQIKAQ
ncbi:MAG: hypothetical protein PHX83_09935 [Acidobacteriia bacterium]|nr:hypothetical protein [Terriglobia bacterium]